MYGINSFATALINSMSCYLAVRTQRLCSSFLRSINTSRADRVVFSADEFKNDPRNPAAKTQKPTDKRS